MQSCKGYNWTQMKGWMTLIIFRQGDICNHMKNIVIIFCRINKQITYKNDASHSGAAPWRTSYKTN